jgi:hypothetical protein
MVALSIARCAGRGSLEANLQPLPFDFGNRKTTFSGRPPPGSVRRRFRGMSHYAEVLAAPLRQDVPPYRQFAMPHT